MADLTLSGAKYFYSQNREMIEWYRNLEIHLFQNITYLIKSEFSVQNSDVNLPFIN